MNCERGSNTRMYLVRGGGTKIQNARVYMMRGLVTEVGMISCIPPSPLFGEMKISCGNLFVAGHLIKYALQCGSFFTASW